MRPFITGTVLSIVLFGSLTQAEIPGGLKKELRNPVSSEPEPSLNSNAAPAEEVYQGAPVKVLEWDKVSKENLIGINMAELEKLNKSGNLIPISSYMNLIRNGTADGPGGKVNGQVKAPIFFPFGIFLPSIPAFEFGIGFHANQNASLSVNGANVSNVVESNVGWNQGVSAWAAPVTEAPAPGWGWDTPPSTQAPGWGWETPPPTTEAPGWAWPSTTAAWSAPPPTAAWSPPPPTPAWAPPPTTTAWSAPPPTTTAWSAPPPTTTAWSAPPPTTTAWTAPPSTTTAPPSTTTAWTAPPSTTAWTQPTTTTTTTTTPPPTTTPGWIEEETTTTTTTPPPTTASPGWVEETTTTTEAPAPPGWLSYVQPVNAPLYNAAPQGWPQFAPQQMGNNPHPQPPQGWNGAPQMVPISPQQAPWENTMPIYIMALPEQFPGNLPPPAPIPVPSSNPESSHLPSPTQAANAPPAPVPQEEQQSAPAPQQQQGPAPSAQQQQPAPEPESYQAPSSVPAQNDATPDLPASPSEPVTLPQEEPAPISISPSPAASPAFVSTSTQSPGWAAYQPHLSNNRPQLPLNSNPSFLPNSGRRPHPNNNYSGMNAPPIAANVGGMPSLASHFAGRT